MNPVISNSIAKSSSYTEYRSLISKYAQEGKTTGLITSPDYINYTKLNESRMHRLDKTIEVTQETKAILENDQRSNQFNSKSNLNTTTNQKVSIIWSFHFMFSFFYYFIYKISNRFAQSFVQNSRNRMLIYVYI